MSMNPFFPFLLLLLLAASGYSFHHPIHGSSIRLITELSSTTEKSEATLNTDNKEDDEIIDLNEIISVQPSKKNQVISQLILDDLNSLDEFSACLSPKQEKEQVLSEGEEFDSRPDRIAKWKRLVKNVKRLSPFQKKTKKGKLVLMRCGHSVYHANGTFTGWLDPPLSERGLEQCKHAASLLVTEGFEPDVVYTSRLKRSIVTSWKVLEAMDSLFIPVVKTYRLNQRMYGSLQGLSKSETAAEVGVDVIQAWRNTLKAKPPRLLRDDPSHPCHDRRYADLDNDLIPSSESIFDCKERARPLWDYKIKKDIEEGKTVLVIAHRDSLRGIVSVANGVKDEDIGSVNFLTGVPAVYKFDDDMNPIEPEVDPALKQTHTSGVFLEKIEGVRRALETQNQTQYKIENAGQRSKRRLDNLQTTMANLRGLNGTDSGSMANGEAQNNGKKWTDDSDEFEDFDDQEETDDPVHANILPLSNDKKVDYNSKQEGPFVVLIRHGRTPHNNMGLFTGWEDPPLAEGGVEDAMNAGRLLKRHGFEFDVVYTSWLTRAIQTAYYCLSELDMFWIPMVKSWRLNERMYGDLTGKSKKMIANEYGEDQLVKWRRGHAIRPPPTSSYSLSYPGNDLRRAKHFKDLRISWRETINRSIESRKFSIHRRFPKTESLKDCMDRSIPFYTQRIKREAVDQGKRVLITSHENAIRGILMHLCDIPQEAMNKLHLPNGLPLVYNVRGRCITLLDDGSGADPMGQHDFGPAAKYLFRPCELDDQFFEGLQSKEATQ
mmetsp:Transcript_29771/g.44013  ORF Transcript_29771/g.44013 Transcript_29771/m.44013 type:complete len:773 (+) Transcript_29771:138-2456(+)